MQVVSKYSTTKKEKMQEKMKDIKENLVHIEIPNRFRRIEYEQREQDRIHTML